jgi:predicted DNA-binding transcriptional regulator AlpA
MMGDGKFPKNFRISPRLAAWRETEIAKWQNERIAGRDGEAA